MAKKIYDVKPPKVARKSAKKIKEFLATEEKVKKTHAPARRKKEGRPMWMPVSIGGAVVLLIVCVFLFFKLPKADIAIWPKVETLSFKQTLTADKSASLVDEVKAIVPAQYFQASKTESQEFPATGNGSNEGLASGTITVYNKFDPPTSFTFKAGTRFISDSGKLFIAPSKVIIPAAKKSGSKIIPGSVQIKVQAAEGGDSYNIAPSNFSVPGLKGTPSYYSVYASSTTAMSGGYAGKVKKVTNDDIAQAKDTLTKKAIEEATSDLKSQISSDYVLLDNAISSSIASASTQTKSGTIADNFTYQTTAKASALAFKKSDLNDFAKQYIISQMPEGKKLLDNSFKINYSATSVDVSGGKATLILDFSSGVYKNIDVNSMALSLLGENSSQINQTINNSLGDQAPKIEIKFWPFWVTSAPKTQKAIHIQLKF
jgi:hypothetical protein